MTDNVVIQPAGRRAPRPAFSQPVEWLEVLRAAPDPETQSYALSLFKRAGFSASSWPSRSSKEAMAQALTKTEDRLEDTRRATPKRDTQMAALRTVRRRLELELWP